MSLTRFNYDDSRTHKKLQESSDICRYRMNVPGNYGEKPLYYEDPHIRLQKWAGNLHVGSHPVDIASELDGRSRRKQKYCTHSEMPFTTPVQTYKKVRGVETMSAYTDETRASHPAWLYRDLEQVRWEHPIHDPQENVCKHFYNNIDTRLVERDNFNADPIGYYAKHC